MESRNEDLTESLSFNSNRFGRKFVHSTFLEHYFQTTESHLEEVLYRLH